ncbi:MAG: trypsin-like peptidase domain-containing protein [Clostridiales bacterium]|nr:trypsin-like peptidase domain-containing protein [Clostridiales bacterium]
MYYYNSNNSGDRIYENGGMVPYGENPNGKGGDNKKKNGGFTRFLKKFTSLTLAAALFGSVSAATFSYVNGALTGDDETETVETATSAAATSSSSSSSSDSALDGTADAGASVAAYSDGDDSSAEYTGEATETEAETETTETEYTVAEIAALGLKSVVAVTNVSVQEVESYFGGSHGHNSRSQITTEETTSVGSGVIIKETDEYIYIVTNYHVVEDATTLSVTFVDDETYEAILCGADEDMDIAVIAVVTSDVSMQTIAEIAVAAIGSSDEASVGDEVVAIGNALGYGQSVTYGIISAKDRTISSSDGTSATYLQTDAAINPGNSGGALFNMNGELIGINSAKLASTEVEGMGYAIPISSIIDILESIIGEEL